ncbi:hypothetical protein GCM10010435_23770 [Winogradskya consettensis]|uniref:Uncharacterized protein n=1 Tax=Winogradskya consettensis TaxID=113560 RepID=A0A919T2D6_9ACTN|nr:hypothetical protein [Actinoplanes consettensis]GIM82370.1 hypothetical protein Aco04nite_81170 [Actinoplanes consettensis]
MAELPTHILTDAGFTSDEAEGVVQALLHGVNLHESSERTHSVNIDDLPDDKKEALERFNMAVAADA